MWRMQAWEMKAGGPVFSSLLTLLRLCQGRGEYGEWLHAVVRFCLEGVQRLAEGLKAEAAHTHARARARAHTHTHTHTFTHTCF